MKANERYRSSDGSSDDVIIRRFLSVLINIYMISKYFNSRHKIVAHKHYSRSYYHWCGVVCVVQPGSTSYMSIGMLCTRHATARCVVSKRGVERRKGALAAVHIPGVCVSLVEICEVI